jgi:hypothetical protein
MFENLVSGESLMSKDCVYHGKRARQEISCAFNSVNDHGRKAHFELAGLHIQQMYEAASDAVDRMEANCVAAILSFWKRRFADAESTAEGQVSGEQILALFKAQTASPPDLEVITGGRRSAPFIYAPASAPMAMPAMA